MSRLTPAREAEIRKKLDAHERLDDTAVGYLHQLLAEIDALRVELRAANAKWQDYETRHILPCFAVAKEIGFDLQGAVLDNPGRCSTELLVAHLRSEIAEARRKALDEAADKLDMAASTTHSESTSGTIRACATIVRALRDQEPK